MSIIKGALYISGGVKTLKEHVSCTFIDTVFQIMAKHRIRCFGYWSDYVEIGGQF